MLYQFGAALEIRELFGEAYVHKNAAGTLSITPSVREEFKTLSEGSVAWLSGKRCWVKIRKESRLSSPDGDARR